MLMCGSSPLAEALTRSAGTACVLPGSAARKAAMRDLTASVSAGFNGPWLEPLEPPALLAIGPVADGRPQKYVGELKFWPIKVEPTSLPSRSIRLPAACCGNIALAAPVTASGYRMPVTALRTTKRTSAGRRRELKVFMLRTP